MIKAKSKNINITIILLLLSLLCGISDVRASYTVTDYKEIKGGNIGKDNEYGMGHQFELTNEKGQKTTAYCIDPGGSVPQVGGSTKYEEVTDVPATVKKQIEYACANAESKESFSSAARSIAVGNNYGHAGIKDTEEAYKNAYNGENAKGDVSSVITGAKGSNSGIPTISVSYRNENKRAIVKVSKNGTDGILESQNKNINCFKDDSSSSDSEDYYICSAMCLDESSSNESGELIYEYLDPDSSGADTSTGDSATGKAAPKKCSTKYYKTTDGGSIQYLVACFCDSDEKSGWQNDSKMDDKYPKDGQVSASVSLKCSGKDDSECFPSIPNDILYDFENNGTEICDDKGKTVIKIDEWATKYNFGQISWDEFMCEKSKNYADFSGTSVVATGHFIKMTPKEREEGYDDFCSVSCAEDFKMTLPGPDGDRDYDDSVMVNAGTFFTINDANMESTSILKCYESFNDNAFKDYVKTKRKESVDLYNKYIDSEISKSLKDASCGDDDYPCECREETTTDENGNTTTTTKCDTCVYATYKKTFSPGKAEYSSVTDQLIQHPTETIDVSSKGYAVGTYGYQAAKDIAIKECNGKLDNYRGKPEYPKTTLDNETGEISKKIEAAKTFWDEKCIKWDISNFNREKSTCPGDNLKFSWYDGDMNSWGVDIKAKGDSAFDDGTLVSYDSDGNIDTSNEKIPYRIGVCNSAGCDNKKTENIQDKYVQANSLTITTTYEFKNDFCVTNDGNVSRITDTAPCSKGYKIKGFPVSYDTTEGKYYYKYDYGSIGYFLTEDGKGTDCGRLSYSVLNNFYSFSDSLSNSCYYNVNRCKGCSVKCVSRDCDIGQKTCNSLCKVACVGGGCILDANAGFLATYRTISLNNFLAGRTNSIITAPDVTTLLAYNDTSLNSLLAIEAVPSVNSLVSSTNKFPKSNWDTTKGKKVAGEITGEGEKIYNKDPEYSFKLNPGIIAKIKEYNEKNSKYKYNSLENLTCDFKENYFQCTSPFIDKEYGLKVKNFKHKSYSGYENEDFTGPAKK